MLCLLYKGIRLFVKLVLDQSSSFPFGCNCKFVWTDQSPFFASAIVISLPLGCSRYTDEFGDVVSNIFYIVTCLCICICICVFVLCLCIMVNKIADKPREFKGAHWNLLCMFFRICSNIASMRTLFGKKWVKKCYFYGIQ